MVVRLTFGHFHKAQIFLRWVRWIMTEALFGREYVFVNMDETSVSKVVPQTSGFVPDRSIQRAQGMFRRRPRPDRHDVRTSLLGTVCSDASLQPYLPQVFLPSYSKHAIPPEEVLREYRRSRTPLEYWHDTNGWSSWKTIRRWLTRLRSIISSARPQAWIVVVLDCATSHLHAEVLRHARKLGLLVLLIPAGLTHVFQVLDAYIYADLKRRIRQGIVRHTAGQPAGELDRLGRIRCVAAATHEALVQVDCSVYFQRVGISADFNSLRPEVVDIVGEQVIPPTLPLIAEFATMVGRPAHTHVTGQIHNLVLSGWLQLRSQPMDARPPAGAVVPLSERAPARRRGRDLPQDRPVLWDDVRMARFRRTHRENAAVVPPLQEAINVFLDA